MASEISSPVTLRHKQSSSMDQAEPSETFSVEGAGRPSRFMRPKSASFAALRSAVFQLTCLSDFTKEKIGSGFFADVFKVKHKVTGEVMVLKMNKSKKTSKQMLSEIQLMNRLSHPNILKFKGSCVHEGQLHALTEFINGGSLEELLHDRTVELSWSVRAKIARDIARGMAYLHSRNMFHRDLNSRNCLIKNHPNGSMTTVVADFGLAAKIKQRKRKSYTETVGSPYWMAPECLNGKEYCELADVFSFGITLAEILTRMPADPDFIPRTSHYGLNGEALRKLCEGCPEELFQLMCSCCQMDPDDRPSFDEAVAVLEALSKDTSEAAQADTNNQCIDDTASLDDDHYLRACHSEPFLRHTDATPSSTGSSYVGYRLDSIGSSTASTGSSCGSLIEEQNVVERDGPVALSRAIASSQLEYQQQGKAVEPSALPHGELRKTNSLTLPGSDSGSDLDHSSKLNCSVQTLIEGDDTTCTKDYANGGDSGIDPGELEVFKFPPSTPAYSSPVEEKQSAQAVPMHALDPNARRTPVGRDRLSPSPSDTSEAARFTTPPSPFTQSWASSEFSFQLPHPSTPYAPPCTPVPNLRPCVSCPSSPTSATRPSRFSLDFSQLKTPFFESETSEKARRKRAVYRNSYNFEQSSFDREFEEAKISTKSNRRSVHFDDEVCTNLHQEHFSKMGSRNRSNSSPAHPIIKQSSSYSLTLPRYKSKNSQTLLCKGFNVNLKRDARLSSSLPNLFKC